jgi:retron-type reverse transcriptase
MNTLLALFGIKARFKPIIAYKAYSNFGMNKYMNYQIYRLRKLATTDPKEYFALMSRLMKQSKVLFIIGLNHVEPRWHREFPEWWIHRLYRRYVEISLSGSWKPSHTRKYINKANNKKRPLGIPDTVWRVHNHQVANFISMYLELRRFFQQPESDRLAKRITKEQHGFRTGYGTKTAWMKILDKVTNSDWIYEFDLSRCFPNIHIKGVSKALRAAKVPQQLINKLETLNLTPVANPGSLRNDTKEGNERTKYYKHLFDTNKPINKVGSLSNFSDNILTKKDSKTGVVNKFSFSGMFDAWISKANSQIKDIEKKKSDISPYRGLPQGLPTSPILTITALEHLFVKKCNWNLVMYADDGLIYGNGEPPSEKEILENLSSPRWGIEINREKSRFAKLPGQEIDLKFLGMRLKGDTLSAETREGSVLKYDKHDLVSIYDFLENWNSTYTDKYRQITPWSAEHRARVEKDIEGETNKDFPQWNYFNWHHAEKRTHWEELASSRLFGLIQSRLFQGDWNSDITQCFSLSSVKHSWVHNIENIRDLQDVSLGSVNVFNSTSFACHDLLSRLSSLGKIRKRKAAGPVPSGMGISSP